MPLDPNGIPAGDATTPAPDGTAGGTTPATPAPTRQETALAEMLTSFRAELVDMRRELRNRIVPAASGGGNANATPAAATPPAPANAPAWDPAAILAFRDAVEEAGLTVSVPQRKILEKLYRAESGVSDTVSWVREQADAFGWRKPTAPIPAAAPAQAAAPVKAPETPAPAGTAVGGTSIPDDPALLPQSVVDAMTKEEALAHWQRWQNRNGTFQHPWKTAREAERNARAESERAATAVRRLINGGK